MTVTPLLKVSPLPYPASCSPSLKDDGFGVVVEGLSDINNLSPEEFKEYVGLWFQHPGEAY